MPKPPSLVWKRFTKVGDKATCNTCQKAINCRDGTTSGLRKHLKQHKEVFEVFLLDEASQERENGRNGDKRKEENENSSAPKLKQPKISFGFPDVM